VPKPSTVKGSRQEVAVVRTFCRRRENGETERAAARFLTETWRLFSTTLLDRDAVVPASGDTWSAVDDRGERIHAPRADLRGARHWCCASSTFMSVEAICAKNRRNFEEFASVDA
jgi:hypothetical protein